MKKQIDDHEHPSRKRKRYSDSIVAPQNDVQLKQSSSLSSFVLPLEMIQNQMNMLCSSMKQLDVVDSGVEERERNNILALLNSVEQHVNDMKQLMTKEQQHQQLAMDFMLDDDISQYIQEVTPPIAIGIHEELTPLDISPIDFSQSIFDMMDCVEVNGNSSTLSEQPLYMNTDLCAYTFSFLESQDYLTCLNVCKPWRETGMANPIALQTVSFPSNCSTTHDTIIQFIIDHVLYRLDSVKSFLNTDPRVITWLFSKNIVLSKVTRLTMNKKFLVSPSVLSMIKTCFPNLNRICLENISKNCCDVTTLFSSLKEIDVVSQSFNFYDQPDIYESVHTLHLKIYQSTELCALLSKFPNLTHLKLGTQPVELIVMELPAGGAEYTLEAAHPHLQQQDQHLYYIENKVSHLEIDQISLESLPLETFSTFTHLKSIHVHSTSPIDSLPRLDFLIKLNSSHLEEVQYMNHTIPYNTFLTICSSCTNLSTLKCDIGGYAANGIENLTRLRILELITVSPISDTSINQLVYLEDLTLSTGRIDFSALPSLRSFTLRNERDTVSLSIESNSLYHIDLTNSKVTDAKVKARQLQTFIGSTNLTKVSVDSNELIQLSNLSQSKRLAHVEIRGNTRLQELDLLNKGDSVRFFHIENAKSVKSAKLSKFSQKVLSHSDMFTSLRRLYLQDVTVSNQEFFGLTIGQLQLETLSFVKCSFGGNNSITNLKPSTTVRELLVSACVNLPYQTLVDAFPLLLSLKLQKLTMKSGGSANQLQQILCTEKNWQQLETLSMIDNSYYLNQARLQDIVSKRINVGKLRQLTIGFETQKGPSLSSFHISNSTTLQKLVLSNCTFAKMKSLQNLKSLTFNRFEKKKELSDFKSIDKLVDIFKSSSPQLEELHVEMEVSTSVAELFVTKLLAHFSNLAKLSMRNESFYEWSKTHTSATFENYSLDQLECYQRLQKLCMEKRVHFIFVDHTNNEHTPYH